MQKLFLLFAMMFISVSIYAAKVTDLYSAEVPVASQSEALRMQAERQGLMQVLIKLSADPQINTQTAIKAALKNANNYVQEFSYAPLTNSTSPYQIRLSYDANSLTALLKRANIPFWSENRPLILVWLATSHGELGDEIVGDESTDKMLTAIKMQSKRFGLPVIFPVMDMSDMVQVTVEDVVNETTSILQEAGKRYAPDAMLIGKVKQINAGYSSEWRLVVGDKDWNWNATDKTENAIVNTTLQQAMQILSKHYAVQTANAAPTWIKLQVERVTERNQLTQLTQYIKQLTPVQQVQLAQVSGDSVEFAVQVRGSLDVFQQSATIGDSIRFKSQDPANKILVYEWVH